MELLYGEAALPQLLHDFSDIAVEIDVVLVGSVERGRDEGLAGRGQQTAQPAQEGHGILEMFEHLDAEQPIGLRCRIECGDVAELDLVARARTEGADLPERVVARALANVEAAAAELGDGAQGEARVVARADADIEELPRPGALHVGEHRTLEEEALAIVVRPEEMRKQNARQIEVVHVVRIVVDRGGGLGVALLLVEALLLEAAMEAQRIEREIDVAVHGLVQRGVAREQGAQRLLEPLGPGQAEIAVAAVDDGAHRREGHFDVARERADGRKGGELSHQQLIFYLGLGRKRKMHCARPSTTRRSPRVAKRARTTQSTASMIRSTVTENVTSSSR